MLRGSPVDSDSIGHDPLHCHETMAASRATTSSVRAYLGGPGRAARHDPAVCFVWRHRAGDVQLRQVNLRTEVDPAAFRRRNSNSYPTRLLTAQMPAGENPATPT
jgi:hypothetical protein